MKKAIKDGHPAYDLDKYPHYSNNVQEKGCKYDWLWESYEPDLLDPMSDY